MAQDLGVYITIPLVEKVARPKAKSADAGLFKPAPFFYYNTIVLASPTREIVGHYRKNNHWGYIDNACMTAGTEEVTVDTEYGRVGLAVCFDVHVMFERYGQLPPEKRPWYNYMSMAFVQ